MDDLPFYIPTLFLCAVITVFGFLYFMIAKATEGTKKQFSSLFALLLGLWLTVLGVAAEQGFFLDFDTFPPVFLLAIIPPLIIILLTLTIPRWHHTLLKIPITSLSYIHIIRVPIEIVLWWLFLEGFMPEIMTFEGRNYDIIMGISAPFAAIFLVGYKSKNKYGAIGWNVIGIILLLNIVSHAILSTPLPFQQFGFDQPNVAVFHFPFIWLPGFIVPAVLFCHIISLVKLFKDEMED